MFPLSFRMPVAAAIACLALTSLTACSHAMNDTVKPEYRTRPQPEQAYRIAVEIGNPPGEFKDIRAVAQYDVDNVECLPPPDANGGGYSSPVPTRSLPFELVPDGDGRWQGEIFADAMLDEDYHGRGVCHWALKNVQIQLKATGAEAESLFMADLYGEQVLRGDSKRLHYSRNSYPRHPQSTLSNAPVSGQPDRSRMATLEDGDIFTITISATEETP